MPIPETYTMIRHKTDFGTLVANPEVPEGELWIYTTVGNRVLKYKIVNIGVEENQPQGNPR